MRPGSGTKQNQQLLERMSLPDIGWTDKDREMDRQARRRFKRSRRLGPGRIAKKVRHTQVDRGLRKCAVCSERFSLSTAMDEQKFCSMPCEMRFNGEEFETRKKRRSFNYGTYDKDQR